jgi:quercetin dioxygenase-like cupin family protein
MTTVKGKTIVLGPNEGKAVNVAGMPMKLLLEDKDSRRHYSIVEITVAAEGAPQHWHHEEDEGFYVLEGELKLLVGKEVMVVGPGSFAFVPKGIVHAFSNAGATPARFLHTISPAGFEHFFEDISGLTLADMDKITQVAKRYGLEFVGPPLPAGKA